MGKFTKRVRNDEIVGPLRRAFKPDNWRRAFNDLHAADAVDQNTYAAGLALHNKFEAIRGVLKLSASDAISATTKLRAFVATANHNFFVARDKTRLALANFQAERDGELDEVYAMEEMEAIKLSLTDGFDWKPNEVMEGLVDGIELPIRMILQANPNLAGNPRMNRVQWTEVGRELNLGILYRHAEDVWSDCLWNGYEMIDKGQVKVFLPQDVDVLNAFHVGLARRSSLMVSFSILAAQFQREALARGARLRIREVCGIERRGKRQVIKVSNRGVTTAVMEGLNVHRNYAAEPYYEELLTEPLNTLHGLTLSALIDAWTVISRAAHVLAQSIGDKHLHDIEDADAHALLPKYAATLQVEALVNALGVAAGINKPVGRRIVEFFTFRGTAGQEIWAQPLVPVGPDTVAPIFGAAVYPNLRRLVDVWMRQAGLDLARRGPAFEEHVRKVVAEAIVRSKLLSPVAASFNDDYTLRPAGGRDEQIDLVFSVGNTVFVAEAKCILEPTDTKGIAMHRKTVQGAAEQVLRKANAIEENRATFIADALRHGMSLTQDFKIKPLVIVSTATHVGVAAQRVPVIDEFILGRFLDGELEDFAYQPGDPAASKRIRTLFYSNAAEAEERAPQYFESPPQLERFIKGIRPRVIPIYPADDTDWTAYVATVECVAGGVPLSLKDQVPSEVGGQH